VASFRWTLAVVACAVAFGGCGGGGGQHPQARRSTPGLCNGCQPDNRTVRSPLVRRALALAYPYRAVIRLGGLIPGVTALPATTLTPPGVPGRRGHLVGGHRGFRTDPLAARALLHKAGALGFPVRFRYDPHSPASVSTSEALVRALVAAGFRATPRPRLSKVDLRTATRCAAWPSGSQWVPPLFASSPPNLAEFSEPSVDRELARIRAFPLEKQMPAYDQVEHQVLRRWSPMFAVYYGGVDLAHGSRVAGMVDDDTLGMPTWNTIWVRQ
jgi:peptide/nickel transport system substrate-binding protein